MNAEPEEGGADLGAGADPLTGAELGSEADPEDLVAGAEPEETGADLGTEADPETGAAEPASAGAQRAPAAGGGGSSYP